MNNKPCQHCNGTGIELDQSAISTEFRAIREDMKVKAKDVAERMNISAGFLCDLEYGRRAWRTDHINAYLKAVKSLAKKKNQTT